MKQDNGPLVLLLLAALVGFALSQFTPNEPWSPPYLGSDLGWSRAHPGQSYLMLDTRGLETLPALPFLPHPLPTLQPGESLEVTPLGVHVRNHRRAEDGSRQYPRLKVTERFGENRLSVTLYQPRIGRQLFSGPIEGRLALPFYSPLEPGIDPASLGLIPAGAERAIALDPAGLQLDETLRNKLIKEWKRWEFEPYVTLADSFKAPFCYAEWEERSMLVLGVKSIETVEKELQSRFPPNLIKTVSSWSHATSITGFQKLSGPAWMLRGQSLVATPDGGTGYLENLLNALYSTPREFQPDNPMLQELGELAGSEKGWHVCIIEKRPTSRYQWGALLRWPEPDKPKVEGFMVVWVPAL